MDAILNGIAAAAGGLVPVLYALVVAATLDVLSGIYAAWRSGTLNGQYVAEFVRSHVANKIGPIMLVLLAGVSVGGTDSAAGLALIATATASIAAYLASVVSSITANLADASAKTKGLPDSVKPS